MACTFLNILPRDGTNQLDRLLPALQSGYVQIEERSPEQWFSFAQQLAGEINYYDNQNNLNGDWAAFFETNFASFQAWIQSAENQSELPSHFTLFIAFLRLMEVVKNDLNGLTFRHLDFYYRDILGFKKKAPVPDAVHVLFELANNADQHLLKAGTMLKAGKDASKKEQLYEIEKDVVLNRAKVSALKTVFVDQDEQSRIYMAPVADSLDGLGKDQGKEGVYWSPFGESQEDLFPEDRTMVEAEVGFAIASPILLLKEGERKITLKIELTAYSLSEDNIDAIASLLPAGWEDALLELAEIDFETEGRFRGALVQQLRPLQGAISGSQFNALIGQVMAEAMNHPLRHIPNFELDALFKAAATSEIEWIGLEISDIQKVGIDEHKVLEIEIDAGAGLPPITGYREEVHAASLDTHYPVVRLILNTQNDTFLYGQVRRLQLVKTTITVTADDMQDLVLQNDHALLDTGGNIQPFGPSPSPGASFFIGSHEAFSKKLDTLRISWEWVGLPDVSFADHYGDYSDPAPSNSSFIAKVSWLDNRSWEPGTQINLFSGDDDDAADTARAIVFGFDSDEDELLPVPYNERRDYYLEAFEELNTTLKRGFIRLDLGEVDFGHRIFPNIFSSAAINDPENLPHPPYTPTLKSIQLSYQSTVEIDHLQPAHPEACFHIETFGARQTGPGTTNYLLPQYTPGTLYIGLEKLEPPQNLSLLFQVLEGSGDPDFEATREDVRWSLLSGDHWLPLSSLDILEETTLGLQTSGIIGYSIFREATLAHSLLPKGLHWLRATLDNNPVGVPKMAAIRAQAARARFAGRENDPSHYDAPLPADTIRKLRESAGAIKNIHQPFVSFGNEPAETDRAFYTRVSERLRHRQRAITLWDYEHLVLEAFPEIYKVKCVNHSRGDEEIAPGKVTVVVIPDLRQKNAIDPLRPRASIALRTRVYDYLKQYLPLFVELEVINPLYEAIQLDFSVRFHDGYDRRYYTHQLNEELVRFLSPWAFEEGRDIVFGGQAYKSIILDFIEERPYVDFVTNFVLLHFRPGIGRECIRGTFIIGPQTDIAQATTPRSILVSAPRHRIHALAPGEYPCTREALFGGIGSMIVDATNIVG